MFIHTTRKDPGLEDFRADVRAFCATKLASSTRDKMQRGQHLDKTEHDAWLKVVGNKGWLTGKWPQEHGGLSWEPAQAAAFAEEMGKAGAPWLVPFGTTMVGPVIYTFGTEAQKQQYLPAIRRNETWWCQGYSEPGAGSDLASLRTQAVRDGDDYIVNGQKTWTTLAHWADMMFCLVRTDPDVKKQDGISFLLIDMNTPGITVKPIVSIDMSHHLNEVFFDDVRVPCGNLIGEENKGWTYAKFLLANERVGVAETGKFKRYIAQYRQLLQQTHCAGRPLIEDPEFRTQLADLRTRLSALEALVADQLSSAATTDTPSMIGASALKIRGSELQQAILESIMEVLGYHGLAYETDALLAGWNADLVGPQTSAGLIHEHLYRRAATIYGGSSEVQRSIIAKAALGL